MTAKLACTSSHVHVVSSSLVLPVTLLWTTAFGRWLLLNEYEQIFLYSANAKDYRGALYLKRVYGVSGAVAAWTELGCESLGCVTEAFTPSPEASDVNAFADVLLPVRRKDLLWVRPLTTTASRARCRPAINRVKGRLDYAIFIWNILLI